jgi:uncharacterized protein (DUF952 family)
MILYRIISEQEWFKAKAEGKVPRCNSDNRDNCVHLTKFEDIKQVSAAYFSKDEKPVVIEIDTEDFEEDIYWESANIKKPWDQPNLKIDNIRLKHVKRFCYLKPLGINEFEIGEFLISHN